MVDSSAADFLADQGWATAEESNSYTVIIGELQNAKVLLGVVGASAGNVTVVVPGSAGAALTSLGIGFTNHRVRISMLRDRGQAGVTKVGICLLQLPFDSLIDSMEAMGMQAGVDLLPLERQ